MSRTRKRKQTPGRASSAGMATQEREGREVPASAQRGPVGYARGTSAQSVLFAAMLTLGFLGMAIFFTFFYTEDPDHYLYSGVAALTAVGWLILLARRWSQYRPRV